MSIRPIVAVYGINDFTIRDFTIFRALKTADIDALQLLDIGHLYRPVIYQAFQGHDKMNFGKT